MCPLPFQKNSSAVILWPSKIFSFQLHFFMTLHLTLLNDILHCDLRHPENKINFFWKNIYGDMREGCQKSHYFKNIIFKWPLSIMFKTSLIWHLIISIFFQILSYLPNNYSISQNSNPFFKYLMLTLKNNFNTSITNPLSSSHKYKT